MISTYDREFIRDVVEGFVEQLRFIITDHHQGLREMHEEQMEKLNDINEGLTFIADKIEAIDNRG